MLGHFVQGELLSTLREIDLRFDGVEFCFVFPLFSRRQLSKIRFESKEYRKSARYELHLRQIFVEIAIGLT